MRLFLSTLLLVAVVALSCGAAASPEVAPSVPVWPAQYHITGMFSMPAFNVNEVLEAWVDNSQQRQKLSYFHGMDVYLYLYQLGVSYGVVPAVDRHICQEVPTAGGPTFSARASATSSNNTGPPAQDGPMIPLVPDLTQPGWEYTGMATTRGEPCHMWRYVYSVVAQHESFLENVTNTYTMYTSATTQAPVLFLMEGFDFVFGSHPDVYLMEYYTFDSQVHDSDFDVPSVCASSRDVGLAPIMHHLRAQLARLTPPGGALAQPSSTNPLLARFHMFARRYGKFFESAAEHDYRFGIFKKNVEYIDSHNARLDVSYTCWCFLSLSLTQTHSLSSLVCM
jgi:Cathepsin propeptide inhibitor domain (I29)